MSYETLNNSLRRSIALMKFVFLVTALAIAALAAERSLSGASRALPPQELLVTANFTDKEVQANFALTLTLSRPLPALEGRLAILIGQTDFTNLFTPTGNSLSYFVGSGQPGANLELRLLTPAENALAAAGQPIEFSWTQASGVALYQLEIADQAGQVVLSALLQSLTLNYRAPSWLRDTVAGGGLQWRVSALDQTGAKTVETPWRRLSF